MPSSEQPAPSIFRSWLCRWLAETRGSQIVEFAVSLPLLVVFTVGIYDFGGALTLRHKVAIAALDGARIGSNQPTSDLTQAVTPGTIQAIVDSVDSSLLRANVNDCGLGSAPVTPNGSLKWQVSATCPNGGTLTLNVDRGFTYPVTLTTPFLTAPNLTVEATKVTLSYPYKWQFNNVIGLIVPGATYAGTTNISSQAVMQNLN